MKLEWSERVGDVERTHAVTADECGSEDQRRNQILNLYDWIEEKRNFPNENNPEAV